MQNHCQIPGEIAQLVLVKAEAFVLRPRAYEGDGDKPSVGPTEKKIKKPHKKIITEMSNLNTTQRCVVDLS